MAITVSHQPDFGLLARAGYYSGAGADRRWQAEMAQRERMQERALASNFLSQQLANVNAIDRMGIANEMSQQRDMSNFAQRMDLQNQGLEYRKQLDELTRQDRMERMQFEAEQRQIEEILKNSNEAEADFNSFLLDSSKSYLKEISELRASGVDWANESDRRKYEKTVDEIGRILSDETLTPNAKAQAAYQLAMAVPALTTKIPNTEEIINDSVVPKQYTLPDGSTGYALFGLDRDGRPRLLADMTPKPESAKEDITDMPIEKQVTSNYKAFLEFWKQAATELAPTSTDGNQAKPDPKAIRDRVNEMIRAASGAEPASSPEAKKEPEKKATPADVKWVEGKGWTVVK